MKCIDCGREGDGRFCGECGSKMLGERTDNNLICCGKLEDGSPCGTVLFATQNFCKSCGTRVEHTLLKAVADNLNFKEDGSCRPSGDSGNFGDSDDEPLIQMSEEQLTPFKPVRSMPVECKQEACVVVEIEPEVKVTAWSPSDTEIDGENDEDEGGGDDDDDGGGDGNDDVDDNDVDDDDVNDDDVDDDDDSDVHKQSSSRKRKRHKTKYTKTRRKKAKRSKKEICALSVQRNKYGETPLHKACIKGELEKVKKLIADGHPINVHDHSGWSPLHEASNNKWYDVAECLLKHGANIDDPGGEECQGMTPLVDAASVGCLDLVELLLEYGANTMAQDDDKMTALDHLVKLHEEDSDEDEDTEAQFTTIVELLEKRMIADKGKKKVKHLPKSRQCAIRLKSDSSNSKLRERQEIRKKNCKKRRTSKRNAVAESDSDSDSDGTSSSNSRKISITSSPSSDDLDTDGSTSTIIVDYSKDSGSNGIAPCQNGSSDTEQQFTSSSRRGKLKTRTKLETPPPDRPRSKRSIRSEALPGRSRPKRNNRPDTPPPGPSRPKRNIRSSTPPSRSRPKRNMRSETPPSHSRPKRNTRSQTPPSRSRSKRIIRSVTPPSHSRAQTKRGPGRPRGPPRVLKNLRAGRGRRRGHIEERTNIGIGLTEDSRISRANGASTSASAECGDNLSTSQTHGIKASVSVTSEVDAFDDDGNLSSSTDIFKDSDTNTSDIEIPFKTEYSDDSYLLAF